MALLLLTTSLVAGPGQIPGEPQKQPVAITNARVFTVSGEVIENGTVLFRDGKIEGVGADVAIPPDAQVIDAAGKHVYPGLIESISDLGLVEIDSVRATRDASETGTMNPNVRAQVAINPESEIIPTIRANGVLLAVAAPEGGTIAGQGALLMLDGWTWEEMTLKAPIGMHLNWPNMSASRGWWVQQSERDQLRERDETIRRLREFFEQARAYSRTPATRPNGLVRGFDARLQAMIPVLERRLPLMIQANDLAQIQAAVAFAREQNVRIVIVGGADAAMCAEQLKANEVPVIILATQRMPPRRHSGYDDAYALPARLTELGVKYCIASNRRATNIRNLPYQAGCAVAYGLSEADALRSITLWPAEILGVADRVGSLEPGKDATLFIASGDILQTPTQVERAWIQGREVDLSSRHTRLYQKYREKYRRQSESSP
jgi:imidazolonepropionase-like amidohydrolase